MKYVVLATATAGSATAGNLTLQGGMSIIDGTFITAMFIGITAIITAIGIALKRQMKATKDCVSRCECEQHRAALSKRMDEIGPALNRIFIKLDENDKKSEERAMQLHRRIDPILEKTAANAAELKTVRGIIGKERI